MVLIAAAARAEDVGSLTKKLKDKDIDIRRQAASEIADQAKSLKGATEETKKAFKDALPAVLAAAKDEDVFVRSSSIRALGYMAPDDKRTMELLTKAIKDDRRVVEAAAEALGQTGTAGIKPLIELAKDKNRESSARKKAISGIASMGAKGKEGVSALTDLLKDTSVRLEAATALGEMGPAASDALTALEAIAESKERDRVFKQAVTTAVKKIKKK